jgi:DHA1 family tetracycline resistance protein-like MFS transporter
MAFSRAQLIVAGSVLVDLLGYGMIMPLLPYLLPAALQSPAAVGLLAALYAGMQAPAAPLLGRLSDRVGRRPVLLLCLAGSAVAYALLARAADVWQFAAAIALAGAAGSSLPTAQAFIADTTPPAQRSTALGLLGAAFGLGIIGGALLGGLLSRIDPAAAPLAAAALALANTLAALAALPESLPVDQRMHRAPSPIAAVGLPMPAWPLPLLLPALLMLNLAFAGLQSIAALTTLQRFGWTPFDNGLLFAAAGLAGALTQGWLLGRLQPHLGDRRLLTLGLLLFAGGLLPIGLISSPLLAYPLIAAVAAGMGLAVPPLTALLTAGVPADRRGSLLGSLQLLVSLALVCGPLAAAALFSRFGPAAPFLSAGLAVLSALVLARPALRPSAAPQL